MPVIGDPLTLAAGIMKEPLPVFLLLVGVAKLGRYLVLAAAAASGLVVRRRLSHLDLVAVLKTRE